MGRLQDLACWRVAELRHDGYAASPFVRFRYVDGSFHYHVLVEYWDGAHKRFEEDPSLKLGMGWEEEFGRRYPWAREREAHHSSVCIAILFALIVASAADNSARAASRREDESAPHGKKGTEKGPPPIDPAHVAAAVETGRRKRAGSDQGRCHRQETGGRRASGGSRGGTRALRRAAQGKSGSKSTRSNFFRRRSRAWRRRHGIATCRRWRRPIRRRYRRQPARDVSIWVPPVFADLGYVENLRRTQKGRRTVRMADFSGAVLPERVLKDHRCSTRRSSRSPRPIAAPS